MKRNARFAAALLAALLTIPPCMAEFTPIETETPQTTAAPAESASQLMEKGLTLGTSSVVYPEITGLQDESIQQQVNDAILRAGKIESRLNRMAVLMSGTSPCLTSSAAMCGFPAQGWAASCSVSSAGSVIAYCA